MRRLKPPDALAITLAAAFIAFLLFASTRIALNFDASYNLLSYQSLFNGTGFNYTYGGQNIPLDPTISTGPELYLPAFVIWKLTGSFDYYVAIYVLVAYYALLFAFLLWIIPASPKQRLITVTSFVLLFFSLGSMFDGNLYIDPLGEVPAAVLATIGIFLLHKKKLFSGALILGLALDVKNNIFIAVIPVVILWFLSAYLIPYFKRGHHRPRIKLVFKLITASMLLMLPLFFNQVMLPKLILNSQEQSVLEEAKTNRKRHVMSRAFGQVLALRNNLTGSALAEFAGQTQKKSDIYASLFSGNRVVAALSVISLLLFFALAKSHFSRYYFLFSLFFLVWWFFATLDPWYRYLFSADLVSAVGAAILLAHLFQSGRKLAAVIVLTLLVIISIPRFSSRHIAKSLNKSEREAMMEMKEVLAPIPQERIFAYGWFQCPQFMILTNKRFGDYLNQDQLGRAKKGGKDTYFLRTVENNIIEDETNNIADQAQLVKAYSFNRLYRLNP